MTDLSDSEFIRAFEAALDDLRNFPKMGMAEDNSELTRILRFGAYYRLEYALEPDRVFILRVKDGRRQAD
jgi:plasmid stabilization system protein ParE